MVKPSFLIICLTPASVLQYYRRKLCNFSKLVRCSFPHIMKLLLELVVLMSSGVQLVEGTQIYTNWLFFPCQVICLVWLAVLQQWDGGNTLPPSPPISSQLTGDVNSTGNPGWLFTIIHCPLSAFVFLIPISAKEGNQCNYCSSQTKNGNSQKKIVGNTLMLSIDVPVSALWLNLSK